MLMSQKAVMAREKRRRRVRGKVFGAPERPRLNVFRSSRHIYAQVIDDGSGHTLVAASTLDKEIRDGLTGTKLEEARRVGELLGRRAREKGIGKVVFDRGGYHYHGRVAALADGARSSGLDF